MRDTCLLDHFIGGGQQRFRDGKAKGLGGLEVEGQLELYDLLDRQIGWFRALENASSIDASLAEQIAQAAASRVGSRRGSGFE